MLKTPDASVTSRQLPLSASSQNQAPSSTLSSQAKYAKNSSQTKNSGNTINLLKATSKGKSLMHTVRRKTQSSNSGAVQDEARQAIPPLEEQHLLYTQQTNAATQRGGRGHIYDTLGDADTVDQFKHIFQNRPINNQIHKTINRPAPTRSDTGNDHCHLTNTNTTQQKNKQQQQQPASSQQQSVCPTEYSKCDQQLAKEQLRMVRRNLRNCSPNSSYFRRYAALVDDWRNFLPEAVVQDNNSVQHQYQQQSQQQRYQNDKDEFSEGSVGMFSAHDLHDGSEDEDDNEFGLHRHVVSSKPPLVKKYTYTRTMPSTSASLPSFVKELLREEELAMLVSSAQFNSHHNLAAVPDSQSATWTRGDETEGRLSRNGSMSSTLSSIMSSDDTEANDADADESYGPTRGRVGATTRRNRVTKTNGPRTRYVRHQQRINNNKASSPADNVTVAKSGCQQRQGRRYHELKKIGPADKSPAGRRRSPKHTVNQRHHHQRYTQQQSAHFGRIHLEDIVRGMESEFAFALDHDEGNDEESEDSLTYLVSGYENSGVEDDDEEEDLISSVRRLHQATTTIATQHESSVINAFTAASSTADSTSPQSTLLNSSDAPSEASVEAPSPSSILLAPESTTTILQPDHPPKYIYHKEDQPITTTTSALVEAVASSSSDAAAVVLAKTREMIKDQNEKAIDNNDNSARPSLKLQTNTMAGIAPGALSAFESRPLGSQYSLTKCNSTSSLYIDSTMLKSDVDETLRAVATVLYDKVLLSHKQNDCRTERIVNSSSYQPSERVLMSQADIFDFMRFIFDCGQNLGAENAIITLIYVERMTELGNLSFHAINWRRLLLGALILSIKVWEDLAVFNSDVCAIFEGLSVKDVNALERFSMAKLQYNVSVKRSVYAAYYFRLRDVSEQQYNLHYGKLTLSLSQRDFQGQAQGSQGMMAMAIARNDSCASTSSRGSSTTNNRAGNNGGLMGMGMSTTNGSSTLSSGNTSLASMTHHPKVPIGPGYRKWTLKPLSVREADRLEARSAVYCSNMMMEEQERKDAGCCLDEYSSASPEELHNLSATLLAAASMHTITSAAGALATMAGSRQDLSASASTSSSVATMASSSVSDLATTKHQQDNNGTIAAVPAEGSTEPVRRTLRLKKSRSDFFFQNTTPASIM
ncbi:hypothetical protein BGZ88_002680 [Linnemannia elongata]|nr:hypothetical protein BGZ88_002680 [Linnemannia elongata]